MKERVEIREQRVWPSALLSTLYSLIPNLQSLEEEMTFLFEKLTVYQKAQDLADRVSALTARFPRSLWYLADQFNRGSLSIALNIAEGNGRGTPMDKRRFLYMARGSVFECVSLLDMCRRKELIPAETNADLRSLLVELSKMLSAMIANFDSPDSVREEEAEYA